MKKQRTILTYLSAWLRAACWCGLVVGLMLVCGAAMAELTPITLKHDGTVYSVAFSPDGTLLATASYPTARVWDMPSGRLLTTLKHDDPVSSVAFSPDGTLLATGSQDYTARVWDMPSGKLLTKLKHDSSVYSVVFSPDGKLLATGSRDYTAKVWEMPSGKLLATLKHDNVVYSVAFSPDGKFLATGSDDNTARVWEMPSGGLLATLKHDDNVLSVSFSPDGKLLATGSRDYTARVWEMPSGKLLTTLKHDNVVYSVAFNPDGTLLATAEARGYGNTARVWEMPSGKRLATLKHDNTVWSIAFSPDGMLLATGSADYTAKVWEMPSGRLLATLKHDSYVGSVVFSPDGTLLGTGSSDGTAKVWAPNTDDTPALTEPPNGSEFADALPELKWEKIPNSLYQVQVAKDKNFSQVALEASTGIESLKIETGQLGAGMFFWRVRTVGWKDFGKWSEVRTFKLIAPPTPMLSAPENRTTFTQRLPTLRWASDATRCEVQIAKDAKFSQIVRERNISGAEYSPSPNDLGNGTYYWRVAGVGDTGRSEWSKARSFKINFPIVSVRISRQSGLDATIEIRIEHAKDLYGFQFSLDFDEDLLEVVKVEQGKFLGKNISWNAPEIDNDYGRIKGATAMKTGGGGSSGKGVLARIDFKAKRLKSSSELILRDVNLLNPSDDYIQHYFMEQGSISFPAGQK